MRIYDTHRGLMTALGAGVAGFLVWLAIQVGQQTDGRFWAAMGIVAGAGLVLPLSQLLGGWTKWGWPRIAPGVFLLGFLPVLVCVGWILLATQPGHGWGEGRLGGGGPPEGRHRRALGPLEGHLRPRARARPVPRRARTRPRARVRLHVRHDGAACAARRRR